MQVWAQQPPYKSLACEKLLELFLFSFMKRWEEATPIKAKRQEPRSRGLMQEESHAIVSSARTRASQSRTRTRASRSRTRTITYTRKTKPWSLATGVARIVKPHPYNHVHAQHKAVVPHNRSRTHHQAAPVQLRTSATQSRGPSQQESHASSSRLSTQSNRLQLS